MKQEFVLTNGQIKPAELKQNTTSKLVVYEVLRVIDGIPLFFNDHYNRLLKSVELVGQNIELNRMELFVQLIELAKINDITSGNIKLKVSFFEKHFEIDANFIPHSYPSPATYLNGVEVGLLHAERINPEAKVENLSVREKANAQIKETGVYEVLLVDELQNITEGSRTNFMGIKDNCIYTAPLEKVLHGITLLKTLQIAKEKRIPVRFESISVNSISTFDALFLTGTSPKILPISKVGANSYATNHPVLQQLMNSYQLLIEQDIEKNGIQN